MSQGLSGVREAAKKRRRERFTALLHHVSVELLRDSYYALKRQAAPGVDGVTWPEYETGLEGRLTDLHNRVQRGAYRAQPSRRVYIPKADGRQRPLGIAALEDKIVQQAVVTILNQIYEVDFQGFSYGFRPGRSPHQALDALTVGIQRKRVNWVLDADIRGFFDNMSHEWTMKFVEHRVADRRILRLIQKWLKAGVSEDGQWSESKVGTPQGAVVTPLTQKVILTVWVVRSSVLGRTCRNRNAVTNSDGILADQNVFDQQSHDFLAFHDTKRFRRAAQAGKECCESLCQAQECDAIIGLVSDRLQLSTKYLLALTQCRHAFTQLLKRQESFLIGSEKSFDTFTDMGQLPLQTLLTFS